MKIIWFFLLCYSYLIASPLHLIKKENNDSNVTLLVIGGIHGNEPGGYFAPAILAQHYKILSKNVWIVPNLNQASIQANKRGIHGDMNRKFAHIKHSDKDYMIVQNIKKIILSPQVSLVLNLHDGHGFYRKEYKGSIFNPNAWGQTCVIDQCKLNINQPYGNLDKIASQVRNNVNKRLIKKHHSFNVKNTNTKFDDEAMQNSLTYFAVTHNKPAFAIETSKNLKTLSQKVFYQLLAIEEFMNIMGIKFERDFDLNLQTIDKILSEYGYLYINDNIILNLTDIKKTLRYIPIKLSNNHFSFTHPLGNVVQTKSKKLKVMIGNKTVTVLEPQYFELAKECPSEYVFMVDKKEKHFKIASEIFLEDDFKVIKQKGVRVNIIGFSTKRKDESGVDVTYSDLQKSYSIDKSNKIFRVEFYKQNQFCGMNLIHFR